MSKRNIKRPSGFNGQEQQGFFMVSNFDAAIAITNKLTGTQIRLWVYLMMIDPFADETKNGEQIFKPIPSPQEISTKLGANPEVIVKDMRKLKKLGLYDYRLTEWQGYNHSAKKAKLASRKKRKNKVQIESAQELGLNSPSKRLNNPHQGLNSPSERLNNHPQGLNSPSCEAEVLPDNDFGFSQTIQTLKTSSYVSNYDTHTQEKVLQDKKKENSQEIFNGSVLCHEKITDELAKSITQQEEEFFRSYSANEIKKIQEYVKIYKEEEKLKSNSSKGFNHRSIYKDKRRANKLSRTQRINWQWLPEGAWSINGKLDPAFQEWLAKKWLFK